MDIKDENEQPRNYAAQYLEEREKRHQREKQALELIKEAETHLKSEDDSPAQKILERAWELDPTNPDIPRMLGRFYLARKNYELSVQWYYKVTALCPNEFEDFIRLGNALDYISCDSMKWAKEALDAYKRAVELKPKDGFAYYQLGETYRLLKMPAQALRSYEMFVALEPNHLKLSEAKTHIEELKKEVDQVKKSGFGIVPKKSA